MSCERIIAIEQELGQRFPVHLLDFLLRDFPPQLFFEDAPDNDQWEWQGPDYAIFHTARSFIAYNTDDSLSTTMKHKNRSLSFGFTLQCFKALWHLFDKCSVVIAVP